MGNGFLHLHPRLNLDSKLAAMTLVLVEAGKNSKNAVLENCEKCIPEFNIKRGLLREWLKNAVNYQYLRVLSS